MLIIPAIDLIDGRCVRLTHGDFAQETRYGDPLDQISAFADAGADWVHVVDLDGARSGARRQTALISLLAEKTNARIQCGGGVRTREDLIALFDSGVARAVIGSTAVKNAAEVNRWIEEFGADRICCAFDVRLDGEGNFQIATDGWMKEGGVLLSDALDAYPAGGLRHALVTDISRDGALSGPNLDLLRAVIGGWPDIAVQASGGVSSLADLEALRRLGAAGVIIGRALYEKRFTLEAALAR